MKETIQELEAIRLSWSLKTFTEATPFSSLQKLKSEIEEVEKELELREPNIDNLREEYADCLMCLFDSAGRLGIAPNHIFESFRDKLKNNQERVWTKNPDNTYSHIKPI
jgi:NTP pyrophosphatase (non-canonical NTP hydrolase)